MSDRIRKQSEIKIELLTTYVKSRKHFKSQRKNWEKIKLKWNCFHFYSVLEIRSYEFKNLTKVATWRKTPIKSLFQKWLLDGIFQKNSSSEISESREIFEIKKKNWEKCKFCSPKARKLLGIFARFQNQDILKYH